MNSDCGNCLHGHRLYCTCTTDCGRVHPNDRPCPKSDAYQQWYTNFLIALRDPE